MNRILTSLHTVIIIIVKYWISLIVSIFYIFRCNITQRTNKLIRLIKFDFFFTCLTIRNTFLLCAVCYSVADMFFILILLWSSFWVHHCVICLLVSEWRSNYKYSFKWLHKLWWLKLKLLIWLNVSHNWFSMVKCSMRKQGLYSSRF